MRTMNKVCEKTEEARTVVWEVFHLYKHHESSQLNPHFTNKVIALMQNCSPGPSFFTALTKTVDKQSKNLLAGFG